MECKKAPEGVVAATAARSPGGSKVERALPATPPAQPTATANLLARVFPTLKNLAMNMEADYVETEASGRGCRLQKLRKIFGETAASGGSKRTWAAVEEDSPTTAVSRPSKKRAMTRDILVIPGAPSPPVSPSLRTKRATRAASRLTFSAPPLTPAAFCPTFSSAAPSPPPATSRLTFSSAAPSPTPSATPSPTPASGKRKRAGDDYEDTATSPPPAKKIGRAHV